MVILEAAAAGLPFAAAKVGGIPDLIEHNVTGLLFEPSQPASILCAVQSMITEKGLAEQLAISAHVQAMDQFSGASVAKQHLEVYGEVIAVP